ncbi:MAG: RNA-binding protein, partial [Firmicutes bacterium]|nr:RNA-binding protein [Bacillota bacterium]
QRSLIEKHWREMNRGGSDVRLEFYGGYDDAERTVAVFLPDYAEVSDCPLCVIRIKTPAGGRKLTHRDYLGSLTGLGLKREMTGDILTVENGADIIVLEEVKDFILLNYSKAGRTTLTPEAVPLTELCIPESKTVMARDTVASLRLDNVISSAFQLSRAKAADAIRAGIVFVNSMQCEKPDMQVEEGAKLVLRGKGKAYLREVGGRTRKDRITIVIERFV